MPPLSPDVEATAVVLSCIDGVASVDAIARTLQERFPERYPSAERALAFALVVVNRF